MANLNYNETVSKARELARDQIRLQMTARRRSKIYDDSVSINMEETKIEDYKKDILRVEYKISKLEEANPDKAELEGQYKETIERFNKYIENTKENVAKLVEHQNTLQKEIEEIQAGEKKVNRDELDSLTEQILKDVVKSMASEIKTA